MMGRAGDTRPGEARTKIPIITLRMAIRGDLTEASAYGARASLAARILIILFPQAMAVVIDGSSGL